jgi:hypothetical protein
MAEAMDLELLRFRLAEVLVVLAAPAQDQVAYFRRSNECADEIANDFDWTRQWTGAVREANLVDDATCVILDALDRQLTSMSGREHAPLWDDDNQLAEADEWREVRVLASAALEKLRTRGVAIPAIEDDLLGPRLGATEPTGD